MVLTSTRRRFMAALAAMGAAQIAGPARAQQAPAPPCIVHRDAGAEAPGAGSYSATANRAEFSFLVAIAAAGKDIVLYLPERGASLQGVAAIKGAFRREAGGAVTPETMQLVWPHTALAKDGQHFGIIKLAQDQGVPVGMSFVSGDQVLGGVEFRKGMFNPDQPGLMLDPQTLAVLYPALLADRPFSGALESGGQTFSTLTVEAGAFRRFVEEGVVPAMDEAGREDRTGICGAGGDGPLFGDIVGRGCFLTSACCEVVGLADDCFELRTLRRFRDGHLAASAEGRADIARYYAEAPAIAARLLASARGRELLLLLYWREIWPAVLLARLGLGRLAHRKYRRMMERLLDTPALA